MRLCIAAGADSIVRLSRALFEAYWRDGRNIADPAELRVIADGMGLDGAALEHEANAEPARAALRANTDELIERGGFGSPTMSVDGDDMYFGNDRPPAVRTGAGTTRGRFGVRPQ